MSTRTGSTPGLRVIIALLAVTIAWAAPADSAKAESTRACTRLAKSFEKTRRVRPLDAARKLRRLHERDPACFEAPEAAYDLMMRVWAKVVPTASGAVSTATVERQWARYKNWAAVAQAIGAFRLSSKRPQALVALGRIHEGFSTYLDEVGNVPGQLVVIREVPESLYHSRAVDLSEYLKIQAETSYDLAVRLLENASRENETLLEAEKRLAHLRSRYSERLAAQRAAEEARQARQKIGDIEAEGVGEGEGE